MGKNPFEGLDGLYLASVMIQLLSKDKKQYVAPKPKYNNDSIEFRPAILDANYAKKWQIHQNDHLQIYKDGVLLRDTLYRVGGLGGDWKDGFISMFKCVESHYSKEVVDATKEATGKKTNSHYLSNNSCIIDANGEEKFVSTQFDYVNLFKGGIYSVKQAYYNARNNELYCESYHVFRTENFTFLNNEYDKDKTRRGVMQISHIDGSYILIN